MAVHTELGCGFLESVYRHALMVELEARRIPFRTEVPFPVRYKERPLPLHYRADLVCFESVVVEVKALRAIGPIEQAQAINYLKASGLPRGLILNFGARSLDTGAWCCRCGLRCDGRPSLADSTVCRPAGGKSMPACVNAMRRRRRISRPTSHWRCGWVLMRDRMVTCPSRKPSTPSTSSGSRMYGPRVGSACRAPAVVAQHLDDLVGVLLEVDVHVNQVIRVIARAIGQRRDCPVGEHVHRAFDVAQDRRPQVDGLHAAALAVDDDRVADADLVFEDQEESGRSGRAPGTARRSRARRRRCRRRSASA